MLITPIRFVAIPIDPSALRYWAEKPEHPHVERLVTREIGGALFLFAVLTPLGMERYCTSPISLFSFRFDVPMAPD